MVRGDNHSILSRQFILVTKRRSKSHNCVRVTYDPSKLDRFNVESDQGVLQDGSHKGHLYQSIIIPDGSLRTE